MNYVLWGCDTQWHSCPLSFSYPGHLEAPQTLCVPSLLGAFACAVPSPLEHFSFTLYLLPQFPFLILLSSA